MLESRSARPRPYSRKYLRIGDLPIKDLKNINSIVVPGDKNAEIGDLRNVSKGDQKTKRKLNQNLPDELKIFVDCRVMLRFIFLFILMLFIKEKCGCFEGTC